MNTTPYNYTQCKTAEKNKAILCGTGCEFDCDGEKCIVGYLVKHHLPDFSKKERGIYNRIRDFLETARINAEILRDYTEDIFPKYNKNPYTDVDILVSYLLRESTDIVVLRIGLDKLSDKYHFSLKEKSQLSISNNSDITQIFSYSILAEEAVKNEKKILSPNETSIIELQDFTEPYLVIQNENITVVIINEKKIV